MSGGMHRHKTPEPVNFALADGDRREAGSSQALLQFAAAESMDMCMPRPRQDTIQHCHPEIITTPVSNDEVPGRGCYAPDFPERSVAVCEVMQCVGADNELEVGVFEGQLRCVAVQKRGSMTDSASRHVEHSRYAIDAE